MYQDAIVYAGGDTTLWCAVKCAGCAVCLLDGPSPIADALTAATVFASFGGK